MQAVPNEADWIIDVDRFDVPAHYFKQADGRYIRCPRKAALCKLCKEHGVPVIPPTAYEVTSKLVERHWGLRWRDFHRPVEQGGVTSVFHIAAISDDGKETTVIATFGENPEVKAAIAAIVDVHNRMVAGER